MTCASCRKEIPDSSKFCPYCGAMTGAAAPQTPPPAPAPQPSRRGGKGKYIAIAAAAAVVVVLVAVLVIPHLLASPRGALEKAAARSVAAYSEAREGAGLPDMQALYAGRRFSQSAELTLTSLDLGPFSELVGLDLSVLEGVGLRWREDVDVPGQKLAFSLTPFYGETDLVTAHLALDGSTLYAGAPEITGDTFYGVDTLTLGRDLAGFGADDPNLTALSFNAFDLMEDLAAALQPDEAAPERLRQAAADLWLASDVQKSGSESLSVNGYDTQCDVYTVTVPQAALEAFLDTYADILQSGADYEAALRTLLTSAGLTAETADELLGELDLNQADSARDEALAEPRELLEKLGDLEFRVGVSGGYIMTVSLDKQVEDDRLALVLHLGGGENYVDDIGLTLDVNGGEASAALRSTGDHAARGGAWTDETTLELSEGGASALSATSSLRYAPGESQNNLSWTLASSGVTLSLAGQLTADDASMALHLDNITLAGYGASLGLRLDCTAGGYEDTVAAADPVMLLSLDEAELENVGTELLGNARVWLMNLIFRVPELASLFF